MKASFISVVGILCFAAISVLAISSEPVYKGNPEEYLKMELTKLGFTDLSIFKNPEGNILFSITARGFSAENAIYADVLKDARSAAQKGAILTYKARLLFLKGVQNPFILLQTEEVQSFGLKVAVPLFKNFKFL